MADTIISPANKSAPLQTISVAIAISNKMGIPARVALANSGVTLDDLQNPQKIKMVTHEQELIVFSNILFASRDSSLGLHIGKALDLYSYGIIGATMLVAPTLGEALQCLFDFPLLQVSYFKQSLSFESDMAIVIASDYYYRPDLAVLNTDMCMASWYMQICDILGKPLELKRLTFVHRERPAHAALYPDIFGCKANFMEAYNAMYFPAELLSTSLPRSNPIHYHMMREYCEDLQREWAEKQTHDISTKILLLLRSNLRRYNTLNTIAQALHMSPKTLSRRLEQAKSSFQILLDSARRDLAFNYLAHTVMPISEIAEKLGYAEASCFRRAFLRWANQSPTAYRAERVKQNAPDPFNSDQNYLPNVH